jgi:hypothetical protein
LQTTVNIGPRDCHLTHIEPDTGANNT